MKKNQVAAAIKSASDVKVITNGQEATFRFTCMDAKKVWTACGSCFEFRFLELVKPEPTAKPVKLTPAQKKWADKLPAGFAVIRIANRDWNVVQRTLQALKRPGTYSGGEVRLYPAGCQWLKFRWEEDNMEQSHCVRTGLRLAADTLWHWWGCHTKGLKTVMEDSTAAAVAAEKIAWILRKFPELMELWEAILAGHHADLARWSSNVYAVHSANKKRTMVAVAMKLQAEAAEAVEVKAIVAGVREHYEATRVLVKTSKWSPGHLVGFIPAGKSARKECGGDLVPGPWCYAFGLSGVMDDIGGTGAAIAKEEAEGRVVRVDFGDVVRVEGLLFIVRPDHNDNIKLVPVR